MLRFTLVSNQSSRKTVPLFGFLYVCVDEELRWSNFDSIYSISSTCDWSFYWGNWHFFKIVGNICWPLTMENSWIDNEMDLSLIQTWTMGFNQIKTVVSFFEYKYILISYPRKGEFKMMSSSIYFVPHSLWYNFRHFKHPLTQCKSWMN